MFVCLSDSTIELNSIESNRSRKKFAKVGFFVLTCFRPSLRPSTPPSFMRLKKEKQKYRERKRFPKPSQECGCAIRAKPCIVWDCGRPAVCCFSLFDCLFCRRTRSKRCQGNIF
mmetsp:Transcript_12636/g.24587  ORF Transcript_12636/g.24587 Transcript_12636/m.24587 type:complete len:114 (+) Transcript_12636:690-1031(+)